MTELTGANRFDHLSKAGELDTGWFMEVAGTKYEIVGLGFNGVETVEIVLRQVHDGEPLESDEITILADSEQKFAVWTA